MKKQLLSVLLSLVLVLTAFSGAIVMPALADSAPTPVFDGDTQTKVYTNASPGASTGTTVRTYYDYSDIKDLSQAVYTSVKAKLLYKNNNWNGPYIVLADTDLDKGDGKKYSIALRCTDTGGWSLGVFDNNGGSGLTAGYYILNDRQFSDGTLRIPAAGVNVVAKVENGTISIWMDDVCIVSDYSSSKYNITAPTLGGCELITSGYQFSNIEVWTAKANVDSLDEPVLDTENQVEILNIDSTSNMANTTIKTYDFSKYIVDKNKAVYATVTVVPAYIYTDWSGPYVALAATDYDDGAGNKYYLCLRMTGKYGWHLALYNGTSQVKTIKDTQQYLNGSYNIPSSTRLTYKLEAGKITIWMDGVRLLGKYSNNAYNFTDCIIGAYALNTNEYALSHCSAWVEADNYNCGHESTTVVSAVASTCHSQGHGEYTVCNECGVILEGSDEALPFDPTNHDGETEVRDETDSTCTVAGYTGDTYCLGCGEKIADGTAKPLVAHKLGDWVSDNENHWKVCSECMGVAELTAHTESDWIIDVEADTEKTGQKHKECIVCGKVLAEEVIPVHTHTPGEAVKENEIAATYTDEGSYEEVVYCSVCNEEISRNAVTVPMKVGTFKITYNLNGGKNNSANPASFKSNAAVTFKTPTRTGYKFEGWYKDSAFKSKITTISKGTAKNVTVYAKWSKITYKITYKLNGGKNGKNPASFNVTTATITLKNPTRAGYKFGGWYTDSKFKNKITKITKGTAKNITVYAKWSIVTYKLTYKLNGGKNGKNPKSYKVTTKTFTLKNATRKGYTFKGWYSDSKFKKKVTKVAKGSTGNKTLYAKWAKK